MVHDFFDLELFCVRSLIFFVFLASCYVFFWNLARFVLLDLIVSSNRFVSLILWHVHSDVTEVVLFRCGEVVNDFFMVIGRVASSSSSLDLSLIHI